MPNLDDPVQTSFYIPYSPQDLPEEEPCVSAYKLAWSKCLAQLRTEINHLYNPTIESILHRISTAHDDTLPGLPYPELPFIAVHNSSTLFINTLCPRLHRHKAVSHLYPPDAPNISTAMRTLISNLLDSVTRQPTQLAAYDITLLNAHFTPSDPLLVILHDFEQFESGVMQDLLYICSARIPSLQLTFLVLLSSPQQGSGTSFIHTTYPRNTLARLRIHPFSVHCGQSMLERVLLGVFFNPFFDPDVMLGPTAVEGIIDYHTRYNNSIDALITSIQLIYLKHFFTEPLSPLNHLPSSLSNITPILPFLRSRLPDATLDDTLHETLDRHSTTFRNASRALRLGFTFLRTTTTYLISKGYRPFAPHPSTTTTTALMLSTLKGQTSREIKILTMYVKKLHPDSLKALAESLYEMIPPWYDEQYNNTRETLRGFIDQTKNSHTGTEDEIDTQAISSWFSNQLPSLLKRLDQSSNPVWDIWYTGSSPFPSDILNPSQRATTLSALLRPHSFTLPLPLHTLSAQQSVPMSPTVSEIEIQLSSTSLEGEEIKPIHELPDTSILFTRYLDSGKLINIHDWYESFKICLDVQRAEQLEAFQNSRKVGGQGKGKGKKKSRLQSPTKDKPKVNTGNRDSEENTMVEEPVGEEDWQKEVQARFIRALHELDYLGFIKHTGRRVEHVARTVFDVGDQGEDDEDV